MKNSKHACDLSSCFLCSRCVKEWLPAVATHKKTVHVKKGTVIFSEGDPVEGIYFMYDGKVKVHKKWGPDKELILRIAGKGSLFGHRGLGKVNVYPISATALEPVTYCFIGLEFFMATLKVNQDFAFQLMMFFATELQESERNMRNLAHMSVKGRLAEALLMLHGKFGVNNAGNIDIALSRQDLASLAGTTYETVFRILSELTQDEILTVSNKDIAITNYERLLRLTDEVS